MSFVLCSPPHPKNVYFFVAIQSAPLELQAQLFESLLEVLPALVHQERLPSTTQSRPQADVAVFRYLLCNFPPALAKTPQENGAP